MGGKQKKMLSAPFWCYYPHRLRDSVSPVCGIFFLRLHLNTQKNLSQDFSPVRYEVRKFGELRKIQEDNNRKDSTVAEIESEKKTNMKNTEIPFETSPHPEARKSGKSFKSFGKCQFL